MEKLRFLNEQQVRYIHREFGTPVFVYSQEKLEERAKEVLNFPNMYGLTARYAMKALPSATVLQILTQEGLHIDASSVFEVRRAMIAGVPALHIQLTAQQLPDDSELKELIGQGVLFNACSLHQLESYGKLFSGAEISVRINTGEGSGGTKETNTGGLTSSFGIWHEKLEEIKNLVKKYSLRLTRMHTHIGSGSDPDAWLKCVTPSLEVAKKLEDVTTISLGGGYKVARMEHGETHFDMQLIGQKIRPKFEEFAKNHGRKLHLEVEPGTFLVANAGAIVCTVIDVVDTGENGYSFIKADAGMTEILRPVLYAAQHPIISVDAQNDAYTQNETKNYIVSGHCCESGDILTPAPKKSDELEPRTLRKTKIGDFIVVEGAGAYCSSMSSKNYNSFPECAEVLLTNNGELKLIRKRQTLEQMLQNELFLESM